MPPQSGKNSEEQECTNQAKKDPDRYELSPLLKSRCDSGLGGALNRHRHTIFTKEEKKLKYVGEHLSFAHIPDLIRDEPGWGSGNEVDNSLNEIARELSRNSDTLRAALYTPLAIISHLGDAAAEVSFQWAAWCWISEAAWRALLPQFQVGEFSLSNADISLLTPIAARQRFLALSEVYRYSRDGLRLHGYVRPSSVERVFGRGPSASTLFHTRAREAREEWAKLLARHESLPAFDQVEWNDLESETDLLLFESQDPVSGHRGQPLAIHKNRWSRELKPGERFSREDLSVATSLLETHHLPRFRLWTAAKASLSLTKFRKGAWMLAGLTAALAVGTVSLSFSAFALLPLPPADGTAMWAAPLTAAVGLVGVATFGRLWAMPWMLRVPAAAAIGLLMLTTMNPAWWHAAFAGTGVSKDVPSSWSGPHPLWVALLLAAAAFAYLLVNVRNTGVGGVMAAGRALAVWVVSAVHSVLVALFGLTWVVPLFSEDGDVFVAVWSGHPEAAVTALLQASAWCLVAGVFSQILWDDRPLTAPLAHAHWRAEER
ncbi:hypothetical protein IDM40_26235 [Nocardiopsis sp. HNM0947]|uniref:Uncharacterized protein n=1 Tax=Nocardiopsis coralli TaxID=2772213 RepID=A0ABR9PE96_9ACTN|nr:hypothetical protein [Nocardiopsis coralli]MBE3002172.1 hypothetical protein [Nocardiopsis coralli]